METAMKPGRLGTDEAGRDTSGTSTGDGRRQAAVATAGAAGWALGGRSRGAVLPVSGQVETS